MTPQPRPPLSPSAFSTTWRHVAKRAAGADLVVVGAALLAAEARRRRGLVTRERFALARRHARARTGGIAGAALLRVRVRALERELFAFARGVEKCKLVALRTAAAATASLKPRLPRSSRS